MESQGENCLIFFVYYGLKSSIFVEVDDLRTTGRKKFKKRGQRLHSVDANPAANGLLYPNSKSYLSNNPVPYADALQQQ